jgi:polysaccharide export outer membrane protein
MKKINIIAGALFLIVLTPLFCAAQEDQGTLPTSSSIDAYVIKPEDNLSVSVWKHEDLRQKIKVDSEGCITFPLIGKIEAAGLTVSELRDKITFLLERDYIVNPIVTIGMDEQSLFIYVYGEVRNPGSYRLEGQMSLLRAITIAGGLSDFASSSVYIKRKSEGNKEQRIKVNINSIIKQEAADIQLRVDDIVVVPRRFF